MKKYISLLLIFGLFLNGSQNSPVTNNNQLKQYLGATVLGTAITLVPYYLYSKWSSAKQKKLDSLEDINKKLEALRSESNNITGQIANIDQGHLLPLPEAYEARKEFAIRPRNDRKDDSEYMQDYEEFKKFIEKFVPPVDDQQALIEQERLIYERPNDYNESQNKFFVKPISDFSRVINAERMKKLIKEQALQYIAVPNEYVFFIGDKFINIADKVVPTVVPHSSISVEEIKELANFVGVIGYIDFGINNIIKSQDGKWTFIDTEDSSFEKQCIDKINTLRSLQEYIGAQWMTAEANIWLENAIKSAQTEAKFFTSECKLPVTKRAALDNPDINMEAAKQYGGHVDRRSDSRHNIFGDYFMQKTVDEVKKNFNSMLEEIQREQAELTNKLSILQKSWYERMREKLISLWGWWR